MSEQQNDKLLDDNLARLLSKGADSPKLAPDAEARMLEHLQAKQAKLVSEKDRVMDTSATLPRRHHSLATSWTVAAAVVLAIAAGILVAAFMNSTPEGDRPQSAVPSTDDRRPAALPAVRLAKKVLEDGTTVIAHKGTRYTVLGPRQIRLEQGDLYLIVAKSDRPFVVKTHDGQVQAAGTRFAVSVGKETSAAVSQGRVTLSNDTDKVELRAGQQGTMGKGKRPQRRPAKRLSYLVNWAKEALSQENLLVEKKDSENGLVALDPWGQETRLTLRKYHVDVHIEDGIARTTIDQTFFNHYPWNTEGTFYFPLPPDASVSRLAMYVNGQLNEGGMVERGRGQQIYNDILYRNRDPALLEMMEGNVFKMRIFPLEGRQEKRIFLSYTQKLDELYGTMRYWFPMDHSNSVAKKLSIRVRVKDGANRYDCESSTHEFVTAQDDGDLVVNYDVEGIKPDQDFLLHLVPSEAGQPTRIATCEKDGHKFVFARLTPDIPGTVAPKPRQWIVLNDVSGSRSKIELKAQRYIVERLLAEADDDDSLAILNLNTRVEPASHSFAKDNVFIPVKQLRAAGFATEHSDDKKPVYVWPEGNRIGGTNLSAGIEAVAKIIAAEKPANPHILYLGDGVATDGKTEVFSLVRAIPRKATFVGIGVGKKVDSLFLQSAADQTGGMFATINPDEDIDWRVFDLVAALNTPRVTKIRVSLKDKDGEDLPLSKTIAYPSSRSLADGETLTIVARSEEQWPTKIVCEGLAGAEKFRSEASLDGAKENAEFIPRLWAKRHIDELIKSDMERKNEIIELSKQYYVVTPLTSLIVLENDAMYEQYKVERGRKDHWALYPAPKTIEVVKEPVDWNRWSWYGYGPGEDAKIQATAKPKSIREIVDSVQFRINAPFYYWQPQRYGQGRHSLYRLLDSEADPTRLLTYWYLLAAGAKDAAADMRAGTSHEAATPDSRPAESPPLANAKKPVPVQPYYSFISNDFTLPSLSRLETDGDVVQRFAISDLLRPTLMKGMELPVGLVGVDGEMREFPKLLKERTIQLPPMLVSPAGNKRARRLMRVMSLAGSPVGFDGQLPVSGLPPELAHSFQKELGRRWSRINRDVQNFNRQYGYRNRWSNWNSWNSIDLTRSASARWYGGLQGLVTDEANKRLAQMALLPTLDEQGAAETLPIQILGDVPSPSYESLPAVAWVSVYGQSLKSQPGTCSILAADYLVKRRSELLQERATDTVQKELGTIEQALANLEKASTRLEDSGPFWSWQGWNYRPQVWSFQPPTVQVYHNYNWSFDLTRYAAGLYSNSFDILNEVGDAYSVDAARPATHGNAKDSEEASDSARQARARGEVSDKARQLIAAARNAIEPVKIRYAKDGPELLIGGQDRFAMTRRTDMYLEERMVCDGQDILHLYKEIGLAARRPATELRFAALRQLAPHLIEPADSLAKRFNVQVISEPKDGFELRLTPLAQPKDKQQQYLMTVLVANDGRIRSKLLTVGGEQRLLLTFEYKGEAITARWFGKDEKSLGEFTYAAQPLAEPAEAFGVDLSKYVVFDMPLRKPSYYAEKLASLDAKADVQTKISLLRHRALALIQELHWRRWGGTNTEAQKSLTEALETMKEHGVTARLGDLTLLGSAGVYHPYLVFKNVKGAASTPLKIDVAEMHPVARYFDVRNRNANEAAELRDDQPGEFIGHLTAYRACAVQNNWTKHYDIFAARFPDSPLLLAATYYASNWGNHPDVWQKLYDHPRWRMMAMMMSVGQLKTDQQRKQVATAFAKMYRDLSEDGSDVPVTAQLAAIVKQHDQQAWKLKTADQFARAKKTGQIAPLLRFAEKAMSWGEAALADQAIGLVRERLQQRDSLLGQFALAQAYWAGSRFDEALKLYDRVLKSLADEGVTASSALLASAARLAQQAGNHGRAIDLEERALQAEHPYLPELINLQAFRQRYNWLWQQYQTKVEEAAAAGDEDAVAGWLARAQSTWLRWHDVDRDNFSMMQQMATLQMTAGRNDDAWLYLSTIIDQRPRDANSFYNVSQWYRGRNKLDEAQQWLARAYDWDTANPRWLLEQAKLLDQLGRNTEARKLYQQIIDGRWAPGLQGYVNQAKSALKP